MEIALSPGISGCKVELINANTVKKSTPNLMYFERLDRQADKQATYKVKLRKYGIQVPLVYNSSRQGWFTMEYLPYLDYISFVETFSVTTIRKHLLKIVNYVQDSLTRTTTIEASLSESAYQETSKPTFPQRYSYLAALIYEKCECLPLPIGNCHGDLTMSNILFSSKRIAFIDFLDVEISSPILDAIKVRQDARFHWTTFMTDKSHDREKVKLVDNWLAQELRMSLLEIGYDLNDYKYWEALNYLRIFKYARDVRTMDYLESIIKEIV